MLIALGVFYMARRTRKRQEQANRYIEDVPYESNKDAFDYGSKPYMSAAAADTLQGMPPFLQRADVERGYLKG